MRAGDLRHRLQIQKKADTRDSYGGDLDSYVTIATVWGAVEPLSGRSFLEARKEGSEISARIRIRYRDDITPDMRIIEGSKTYEIQSPPINVNGRDRELIIMCREIFI